MKRFIYVNSDTKSGIKSIEGYASNKKAFVEQVDNAYKLAKMPILNYETVLSRIKICTN